VHEALMHNVAALLQVNPFVDFEKFVQNSAHSNFIYYYEKSVNFQSGFLYVLGKKLCKGQAQKTFSGSKNYRDLRQFLTFLLP
jgi:hypothetical protein